MPPASTNNLSPANNEIQQSLVRLLTVAALLVQPAHELDMVSDKDTMPEPIIASYPYDRKLRISSQNREC